MKNITSGLAALTLLIVNLCSTAVHAQVEDASANIVRFDATMSSSLEAALKAEGIEILHYYGDQTYLLSSVPTTVKVKPATLSLASERLANDIDASTTAQVEVDLVLAYPEAGKMLQGVLAKAGFIAANGQVEGGVTLTGSVPAHKLNELLASPLILDATPVMDDIVPYNLEARIAQGVTPMNSGIAGAPDLNGEGVVIGVGDGGELSGHPDIGDRVIHSTTYYNPAWGNHPDMVAGIVAGAGNIFSDNRGVACEAELVIQPTSAITYYAPTYLMDFQMNLTNNSYGPSFHCNTANKYYGTSASADQQLFDNPNLLHIYALGNSGGSSCYGMPTSYSSIPPGAQTAKNTLSVANIQFDRVRNVGSSAGPTFDGRLKPEISAIGSTVTSNNRNASYSTGSGTSYASPGVAGMLGLFTQRYKALHAGSLPSGALLKAISCNTADDIGAVGPDFQHGYGLINGVKALRAIENSTYEESTLSQGSSYTKSVITSANTEELKLMLYWPDQAGSTSNDGPTLVNHFDLKVVSPNGDTLLPWVLDPLNPASLAIRGVDTLNNIEQVTIDTPVPGTYTVIVEGITLPYGSTSFVVSWVIQEPEVLLTSPYGGESLNAGENAYIAWDASVGQSGTWMVEYSLNGAAWQTIQSGIPAEVRHIKWIPTAENVAVALRVTNEASSLSDQTNEVAYVIGKPENVVGESMCNGDITLRWSPVAGVNAYQVYKYDGTNMVATGTSSDTFMVVSGLSQEVDSLFSIAAMSPSGKTSQLTYAVNQKSELDGTGCQAPLPVEWVSLDATQNTDQVEVTWTVASELNNDRFEVLRSTTGADWNIIGQVEGRGTTQTTKMYTFVDSDKIYTGSVYYRINQVDYDGVNSLSDIVALDVSMEATVSEPTITLVQNPVMEELKLSSQSVSPLEVSIHDLAGRTLYRSRLQPGATPTILWPASIGAGMYVLRVKTDSGVESLRLLKG